MSEAPPTEFRYRVLLVDGDENFLAECSAMLRDRSYEVLTARDGFQALHILRGATPDLLITELDLPRMSGFELLSVVRTRFPQIGVIAISAEYTALSLPPGTIADAFVSKAPNAVFELMEAALGLIRESPVRSSKTKSEWAPVWISRSSAGYVILTCPECLRSFLVTQSTADPGEPLSESCLSCGAAVKFRMSFADVVQAEKQAAIAQSPQTIFRSKAAITRAREAVSASKALLDERKAKR
jgi:CheY-like chemotaxis protein